MASSAPASAQPRWTARPGSAGTGRRRMRRTTARTAALGSRAHCSAPARIATGAHRTQPARDRPAGLLRSELDGHACVEPQHAAQPRGSQRCRSDCSAAARIATRAHRTQPARDRPAGWFRGELDGDACVEPQHPNRSTRQPRALQRSRAGRNLRAPYTTRAGPPGGLVRRGPPGVQSEALGRSVSGTIG